MFQYNPLTLLIYNDPQTEIMIMIEHISEDPKGTIESQALMVDEGSEDVIVQSTLDSITETGENGLNNNYDAINTELHENQFQDEVLIDEFGDQYVNDPPMTDSLFDFDDGGDESGNISTQNDLQYHCEQKIL